MILSFLMDGIRVRSSNPDITHFYAIPRKPKLAEIVDAAEAVDLSYEELGKLAVIVSKVNPYQAATALGVSVLLMTPVSKPTTE